MSDPNNTTKEQLTDYVVAAALSEVKGTFAPAKELMAQLCTGDPIATES
jgi:hypothetical protein